MMFWNNITKFIVEKMGFKISPYNWCMEIKIISSKQCTILWHVDDLKISHEEDSVIIDIITKFNKGCVKD